MLDVLKEQKTLPEEIVKSLLNKDTSLSSDLDVAYALIKIDGNYLGLLSQQMKSDKILVHIACRKNGISVLEHASIELLSDKGFIMMLVNDRNNIKEWYKFTRIIDSSLLKDTEFVRYELFELVDQFHIDDFAHESDEKKEILKFIAPLDEYDRIYFLSQLQAQSY